MMDNLQPLVDSSESRLLIAGPCSAETAEQTLTTARQLKEIGVPIFRAGLWKPRTKPGGFEGVGEAGLEWLREVKRQFGMLIATEVATPAHVEAALRAEVDILWIGARTTANPFAIQEIADTLRAIGPDVGVLVKNPPNPDLELWIGGIERLYRSGVRRLGAVHRGFSAYGSQYYRNPPMWQIPIELRRRYPSLPIIHDPSHTGGRRELIAELSQQALDLGFDGLIIESHCSPSHAMSDASQQLAPGDLGRMLVSLVQREHKASTERLEVLRRQIDAIDSELIDALSRRMAVSREIGMYKKEHMMPVFQLERHDDIMRSRLRQAVAMGIDENFIRSVLSAIHEESVRVQLDVKD